MTGVRPIRVAGVRCSGDGEKEAVERCKRANVQRWKELGDGWTSGMGDKERREAVQKCKSERSSCAKVETCKSEIGRGGGPSPADLINADATE